MTHRDQIRFRPLARPPRARLAWGLLLAMSLSGLAACRTAGDDRELLRFDPPALDRMDAAVRDQLEQGWDDVRSLRDDPATPDARLGAAFAELGRLYHTYELFDAAIVCYRNAQRLLPRDYRWAYYEGQAHRGAFAWADAEAALRKAHALNPADVPTLVALARTLVELDRPDEAAELARQALEHSPTSAGALVLLGDLASERGDVAAAARWYERLLAAQPQATRFYQPLAMAYRDLGRTEDAREALSRRGDGQARVSDPLMGELSALASGSKRWVDLGVAAFERGDFPEAVESFRKAVEADPDFVGARLNLGSAYARLGSLEQAREQYEAVLERDPELAQAQFNLGVIAKAAGDAERAFEHYRAALGIDPSYFDPRFNLANGLRGAGRCDEAMEHYAHLAEARASAAVLGGRVLCLIEVGRVADARAALDAALQALPDDVLMRSVAARLFAASPIDAMRDGARALTLAEELTSRRRSPQTLEILAMAQAELGRFEEAVATQTDAIELARQTRQPALEPRLVANRERYLRGEPCRDPGTG